MKTSVATFVLIIAIALLGAWLYFAPPLVPTAVAPTTENERTLQASAVYTCDAGKTISAMYYAGEAAPQPAPGEPPVPTGSVDVAIGTDATTTLMQTLSADGARYGNADESLVFWSKGNQALVMRNNSMDLSYTNCVTQ